MRALFTVSFFSLVWSFWLLLSGHGPAPEKRERTEFTDAAAYEKTLEFVENKGQWPAKVKFAAEVPGGKLFLQPNGFVYTLQEPVASPHAHSYQSLRTASPTQNLPPLTPKTRKNHAYAVTFLGASTKTPTLGQETTPGTRNYYLGNDPKQWGSGARGFRQVTYQGLYRGVDMALYEQNGHLKYDLLVTPGASTQQIKVNYQGASSVQLQAGNLVITTSVGTILEQKPVAYQLKNGQRVLVPCAYELAGTVLQFSFPAGYDNTLPLVIDPVIEFSSFTGSTADNWGYTATHDSQGNMYSGGIVAGVGYPVSLGAFMSTYSGAWDMAIIKYNTKVTGAAARLYATYLGGLETDIPNSLVVNSADELLVLGTTSSQNFPTSATAFSKVFKGGPISYPFGSSGGPFYSKGSDLTITRLSANGQQLLASTFLGGTGNEGVMDSLSSEDTPLTKNYGDQFRGDIITDPAGNVYIASNTVSQDFPTRNAFRLTPNGGRRDAVISKMSPDLSQVVWSTYFGGTGLDAAYSIQLDASLNVYVAGGTTSPTLPATDAALQKTQTGGTDGFVAKIAANGQTVLAATFLGTRAYDQAYFLQLDQAANVYVLGQTLGEYPVTDSVYSNANGRQFIHKLNNSLSATEFSTVFGAGRATIDISPTAFLVDDCQRIYVSGWGGGTNSGIIDGYGKSYGNGTTTGLPVTPDALKPTTDGRDFYLLQLGTNASRLLYGTFYGGNQFQSSGEHVDGGTSRFDKRGIVYQAVCGGCGGFSNFPIPPGAHYFTQNNGSERCNNAAFKFDFVEELTANAGPDLEVCEDDGVVPLTGFPAGGVWTGTGVSLNNNAYQFTPSSVLIGSHVLTYTVTGTGACSRSSSRTVYVGKQVPHSLTLPDGPFCGNATPIPLTGSPAGGTFSGPGVSGTTFIPAVAGIGTHVLTYRSTGLNGFCGVVTKTVVVDQPVLDIGPDTVICPGSTAPFQLRANIAGGVWSGSHVSATGLFTPAPGLAGSVQVTYAITSPCVATVRKTIQITPLPAGQASLISSCPSNPEITGYAPFTARFANTITNARSFLWNFGDGNQSTAQAPSHVYNNRGKYQVTLTLIFGDNCQEVRQIAEVVVEPNFLPNIITPNGDGLNDVFIQRFSCLPTELIVYNRWGKEVHREAIYQQNWNGGNLVEGTYFFLLKDESGASAKGWLEIVR
ncbi:gliding motility-associated C-terminal domain-containing protein [Rufibacter sp. LB8]|uniref:DUF7948 domain-containing protein n=1 Tax=Rufibacter sp. LB8 TaxID=2777781 RepID=UPI00178C74D6|nr:gliding motility-associated C-terminal domain-containing protein [Rufibacter sp. LB8]